MLLIRKLHKHEKIAYKEKGKTVQTHLKQLLHTFQKSDALQYLIHWVKINQKSRDTSVHFSCTTEHMFASSLLKFSSIKIMRKFAIKRSIKAGVMQKCLKHDWIDVCTKFHIMFQSMLEKKKFSKPEQCHCFCFVFLQGNNLWKTEWCTDGPVHPDIQSSTRLSVN